MSSTTTTTTTAQPAPGTWTIDPGHAEVAFVGRHFGLTKIRGRFVGVDGTVTITEPIEQSAVDVTIDMASVNSGDNTRDEHLRSPTSSTSSATRRPRSGRTGSPSTGSRRRWSAS